MKLWRRTAIVLLLFLAPGAIWGGITLIVQAHGRPFGFMPQSLLQHSPFSSYLIPGIVLLLSNGLTAFWAAWLAIRRKPRYGYWIAFQGSVLFGWIAIECCMLRTVVWAQLLYAAVGAVLIFAGVALRKEPPAIQPSHG